MRIIEIEPFENGGHGNQEIEGTLKTIPEGWAVIPDDMEIPDTFPFVDIEVEDGVVTSMTAGTVPEDPDPGLDPDQKPNIAERVQEIEAENKVLKAQVEALSAQNDFHEELIVELANVVYA